MMLMEEITMKNIEKLKKLYSYIEKTNNFEKICNYIKKEFALLECKEDMDAYAPCKKCKYDVMPGLMVVTNSVFDVLGSSRTGGYSVYLENYASVNDDNKFMIFENYITIINGVEEENTIEICRYEIFEHKIYTHSYDYDTSRECLVKNILYDTDNVGIVWKKAPIVAQNKYLYDFMDAIYNAAKIKLDKIREYDKYSPFGGEDITYFPMSYGECFVDMMREYIIPDIPNMKNTILKFIKLKDNDDPYITEYLLYKRILTDKDVIEKLKDYHSNLEKSLQLKREIDFYEDDVKKLEKELYITELKLRILSDRKIKFRKTRNIISELEEIKQELETELYNIYHKIEMLKDKISKAKYEMNYSNMIKVSNLFYRVMDGYDIEVFNRKDAFGENVYYISDAMYGIFLQEIRKKLI